MTREQLLDAVGDIRDAFIREAAPPPASYRKQREFPWTGAVAACLALMIVGSTFFLSQMNMGDGATGSGGASAATEDTAEVGESGGTVNGAADGTDDSEPETAAITVTVDGTVYVQAGGVGRHPEACPEGFSYAGEAELPDTGELCPYYADPERPGQIDLVVQQDHFCNLISYPCHRVQGSHGILEDHGDLSAADPAHLLF